MCVCCAGPWQVISGRHHGAALSGQGYCSSKLPHTSRGESALFTAHSNVIASADLVVVYEHQLPTQTMVQACLYPLGRSSDVFDDPLRFNPGRWVSSREEGQRGEGTGFRSLAFGFGARQCVGRRIAENEMQLLLMHVSNSRQ